MNGRAAVIVLGGGFPQAASSSTRSLALSSSSSPPPVIIVIIVVIFDVGEIFGTSGGLFGEKDGKPASFKVGAKIIQTNRTSVSLR